jgi:hypothetical protein
MFTSYYSTNSNIQGTQGTQGPIPPPATVYKIEAEKKEIDLNNPIFVYYLDTRGASRARIEEIANQINRVFPKNVTLWIVPSEQPSKIECVYDGRLKVNKLKEIHSFVSDIHNQLDSSSDFSEFKTKIRDLLLNSILNEEA